MRTLIAILALFAALLVGVYVGANPDTPVVGGLRDVVAPSSAEITVDQVQQLIEDEFYRPVNESKLTDGSLSGMVKTLDDPYTHYFNAKQNKVFEQAIRGSYSGVGMGVNQDKRGLLVTNTYDGSPAKKAGIKAGDVIIAVNGKSIAGDPSDASVAKITGPEGTSVGLTIRSPREPGGKKLGPPRELKLKRRKIEIPVSTSRVVERDGRKVGVVSLESFTETAGEAVARQVRKLKSKSVDAFVLDLRGNGGGRLDQAVAVSSLFLDKGFVVATDGRSRSRREYDVIDDALLTAKPLAVLVDRGSASASEITAGALKFRDRALVVGTRTYGKGVFQEITELKNGGALSLTVGHYVLPGNHKITKNGLKPDLKAADDPDTKQDEALDGAIAALAKFKQ